MHWASATISIVTQGMAKRMKIDPNQYDGDVDFELPPEKLVIKKMKVVPERFKPIVRRVRPVLESYNSR